MPIRNIILHQGRDARSSIRLEIASNLASQHDAHIVGVFVKPDGADLATMEWAIDSKSVEKWLQSFESEQEAAKNQFDTHVSAMRLSGEWRTIDGRYAEVMMAAARHGDLTIVGQENSDDDSNDASLPDNVVLGAGGPVLVIPHSGKFSTIGERVLIAWNGSREASLAIKASLPFLAMAKKIFLYCVGPGAHNSLPGSEMREFLKRHGVEPEMIHGAASPESDAVDSSLKTVGGFGFQEVGPWTYTQRHALPEIDVGNALLSAAADISADLLVMGAYGHSRLREIVFGGVTRHILREMTVPVLMTH